MSPLRRLLTCLVLMTALCASLFAASDLAETKKRAEAGNAVAQFNLGGMYAEGRGVPKDDVEAYAWFNISAVSNQKAKENRDKADLTPEERARAQKRSTELFNEIEARKKAAGN